MKEMIYQERRIKEILDEGYYRDVRYVILNLGTHPTAYVENIVCAKDAYYDDIIKDVIVHGGFTWCDLPHWEESNRVIYLGWDYGHCDDFAGYYTESDGVLYKTKRWKTEEILEEVHRVIDQLLVIKEKMDERDNL